MLTKKQIVLEPDGCGPTIVTRSSRVGSTIGVRFVSPNRDARPEDRSTTDDIAVFVPQIVMEEFGMPDFFTITFEPGDKLNGVGEFND